MLELITFGRSSTLPEFFKLSGSLEAPNLAHNPFIVFAFIKKSEGEEMESHGDILKVEVMRSAKEVASSEWPDETQVMAQWPGKHRSDFFKMTIGDIRKELAARKAGNAEL